MNNYTKALNILNGKTIVSNDRRAPEALRVDFTQRNSKVGTKKFIVVRTYYGVSYTMHNALAKLAAQVTVVKGRYNYYYAV